LEEGKLINYFVENYEENADSVVITWCRLLLVQCAMLKRRRRFLCGTFDIGKRIFGRRSRPSYVAAVQNTFFQHVGLLRVWLHRFRLFHISVDPLEFREERFS